LVRLRFFGFRLMKPKLNWTKYFFKYSNQFNWVFFMIWFFQFFSDLNDFSVFFSPILRAIQVAHEGLSGGQSPNSTVCIVLFLEVWGMLTEKVWLGCSGFFFFFSLISKKNTLELPKKQLCPPICNLINYGSSFFNYCLFSFWCVLKFGFLLQFYLWAFYSIWFFYSIW